MWRFSYVVGGKIREEWRSGIIGNGRAIHAIEFSGGIAVESFCGAGRGKRWQRASIWNNQQITCKRCLALANKKRKQFGISDWIED